MHGALTSTAVPSLSSPAVVWGTTEGIPPGASTAVAYDRLSRTFQRLVDGLVAVHVPPADWRRRLDEYGPGRWNDEPVTEFPPVEHPVVVVHPESGRRALFLNPNVGGTTHIKDLTPEESKLLLKYLFRHITRPEHVVRFRWTPGAVAVWDNRVTVHAPVADVAADTPRLLHRVSLQGQRPTGVGVPGDNLA